MVGEVEDIAGVEVEKSRAVGETEGTAGSVVTGVASSVRVTWLMVFPVSVLSIG